MNRELPAQHKQLAAKERREREEKAKDISLGERIEDMRLAFKGKPHIVVPGQEKKTTGGIILVH